MRLAALLSLLAISFASAANPIEVGGVSIEIPTPSGFARVTPEMTGVVELQKNFVPPTNQQLASFISQNDAPIALGGKIPDLTRRFTVQVAKKISDHPLTSEEFAQLKQMYKTEGEQRIEQLKGQLSQFFADASKGVSRQLDTDVVISAGGVVPLPYHFESDRIFSASMLMKSDIRAESGQTYSEVIAATTTLIHVKDRLLFLYVYGGKEDLDWTRASSKEWAEAILASNQDTFSASTIPSSTPHSGIDWDRVISKSIGGAFIGLIAGLIAWLARRRKES